MDILAGDRSYPFFSLATLLWAGSLLYSGLVRMRRILYRKGVLPSYELPCAVVSVGNLAVGGTGKTPMVIHLAGLIKDSGYRVAIISRGYKGLAQTKGAIVSNGCSILCDARQSGDEPYLMASLLPDIPVVVGKNRYESGQTSVDEFKPHVILLDDAFQHLQLKRDLNLLLLDAQMPFGNSFVLPRGKLREPVSALSEADAVVLTRSAKNVDKLPKEVEKTVKQPLFRSMHKSMIRGMVASQMPLPALNRLSGSMQSLREKKVFVFAGLANNRAFFNGIGHLGARIKGVMGFEDHHDYSRDDIRRIVKDADEAGADLLVTTDKDYVRIPKNLNLPMDLIVMGVELYFDEDSERWEKFILKRIKILVQQQQS